MMVKKKKKCLNDENVLMLKLNLFQYTAEIFRSLRLKFYIIFQL
jgi:hypothetical protein